MYKNLKETYVAPITMDYPDWVEFVSSGQNLLYSEAIRPSMGGAVYPGHVRQNPMTAGWWCPICNKRLEMETTQKPEK